MHFYGPYLLYSNFIFVISRSHGAPRSVPTWHSPPFWRCCRPRSPTLVTVSSRCPSSKLILGWGSMKERSSMLRRRLRFQGTPLNRTAHWKQRIVMVSTLSSHILRIPHLQYNRVHELNGSSVSQKNLRTWQIFTYDKSARSTQNPPNMNIMCWSITLCVVIYKS